MGNWFKHRFPILDTLNILPSIVGGLVHAFPALFLRDRVVNFGMGITTIGMGAAGVHRCAARGAFLIDFTNALSIMSMAGFFR